MFWFWLVTSTFALDHFELFGIKQGCGVDIMGMLGVGAKEGTLVERMHYSLCRHPIMVSLIKSSKTCFLKYENRENLLFF